MKRENFIHLVQFNVATAKFDIGSPKIKDFIDSLDIVNVTADQTASFVWRLKDYNNNAIDIKAFDNTRTIAESKIRLAHPQKNGENPRAFTFKKSFSTEAANCYKISEGS